MSDPIYDAIDWSVLDKFSENTIECRCGAMFRSHCKTVSNANSLKTYTRRPCLACGSYSSVVASRSDPEEWTL